MIPEKKIQSRAQRLVFCLFAGVCGGVAAQTTVPEPASSLSTPPPPAPVYSSPSVLASAPAPSPQAELLNGNLLQWGPVNLRPHLLYRFSYGDGLQANPGESEKTIIQEISPGMLFAVGTHWTLDYTPTLSLYSSSQFSDTLGHNVTLNGGASYENWIFGLTQNYNSSSQPLVETGTQTDQENYLTALTGSYHFSDALRLDLGANQSFRFADNFSDSREWSTLDWLNYQIFQDLDAAVGAGFGYVNAETDMTYEQLQARLIWHPVQKISLNVSGGAEYRQFLNTDADSTWNPLFGVGIEYHPFEQTTLSLSANRRITVSYFENQITETTDVAVGLNQRLLGKLNLNLGYGYNTTKYLSAANNLSSDRSDDTTFFDVRLSCPFLRRATIATFFHLSDNSSSQSDFAYSTTQVGFELGYRY